MKLLQTSKTTEQYGLFGKQLKSARSLLTEELELGQYVLELPRINYNT